MKYSQYGYRINQLSSGSGFNWIFLPGGPGLGSEYLVEFCKKLNLPGNVFLIDFPKDGTNTQGSLDINDWRNGLIDLIKLYEHPVLVTHSFSGMFVMSTPEIASYLSGLVLMNTTTSPTFFDHTQAMCKKYSLPDLVPAVTKYHMNPSQEAYKEFWQTYKYYCYTPHELALGEEMMSLFAYNNESYNFAIQHFYMDYVSTLDPTHIPVMTIASQYDFICPFNAFTDDERYKNKMNFIIRNAGHCPWVVNFAQVKECFDQFLQLL